MKAFKLFGGSLLNVGQTLRGGHVICFGGKEKTCLRLGEVTRIVSFVWLVHWDPKQGLQKTLEAEEPQCRAHNAVMSGALGDVPLRDLRMLTKSAQYDKSASLNFTVTSTVQ